ncbi:MAG: hypothetical protein FJX72_12130 [Armatimonadetes bacterium]|nr:hypothetical protein [Armatimonadota bacterium]
MARLLHDEALAHYALMVLDRIPGPEVGAALRAEAPKLRGKALAGALDLLGERREEASAKLLIQSASAAGPVVAYAAIGALAKLGHPSSHAALRRLLAAATGERRRVVADAIIKRANALLLAGNGAGAVRLCESLDRAGEPAPVRAAAFRVASASRGESAIPALVKALDGPDRLRANAASVVLQEMRGPAVTGKLAQALPGRNAAGRVRLLDVLSARRDASAAPAVARAMEDGDASVRERAIAALGVLGGPQAAMPLLVVASRGSVAERALAMAGLGQLRGAGVGARLVSALDDGSAAVRAAAVTAIRERGEDLPVAKALRMADTDKGEPREAALKALRDIGDVGELPVLLGLLTRLPAEERDPVAATIVAIARRRPSGVEAVSAAWSKATGSADRIALLTCLGEIGGEAALKALTTAANDADAEVQITALRALAEWPTAQPADLLREMVRKPPNSRARGVAFRGYVRLLKQAGNIATAADRYGEMLALAQNDDEKRLMLSGLSSVGSRDALAMARSLSAVAALRPEAELAAVSIGAMTAGAWPAETRAALRPLAESALDEAVRAKAAGLLVIMDRLADFVMVWEVSPAYEREGANFSNLHDIAFAPESGGSDAEVGWRAMPIGPYPDQPWLLDLLGVHGGEQKVAYLRTSVWSDVERDLIAEIGTDDGLKVWWNGEMIHTNNTQRAVAPAQEKVKLRAKAGWNLLMVKVTQNVMGWGLCARFTNADGTPANGLRFAMPSFASDSP